MRNRQLVLNFMCLFLLLLCSMGGCKQSKPSGRNGKVGQAPSRAYEDRVKEFVRQEYVHGIPYDKARSLGPAAIPILESMLSDSKEQAAWPNIVTTLGYVGNESSTEHLIDFLENRFQEEINPNQFRALLLAPPALGHLAQRGDRKAYSYLQELAAEGLTGKRKFKWRFGSYSGEVLSLQMAEVAVNGIAVTGTSDARAFLLRVEDSLKGDEREPPSSLLPWTSDAPMEEADTALKGNIDQGLALIDRIQNEGASKVFSSPQPPSPRSLPPGGATKDFSVLRYFLLAFSNERVDNILGRASTLLQINNQACPDEVACQISMRRIGGVGTFGTVGDGLFIIDDQQELNTVFDMRANIKLVFSGQNSCNTTGEWLGCGRGATRNIVLVDRADPDVWAHEFGHTQGLGHSDENRDLCSKNIMHSTAPNTSAVDALECAAFKK